jgi:protein phosphatase
VTLALRFAARSHPGLLRTNNEDSVYAGPRLLAVADGMGGAAAGDVASAVTIAALAPLDEDAPGADLLGALRAAAMSANDHLREMVIGDDELRGMGTTLVALLFAGPRLGLLHVGDSRCYLLRDGELTQITHDHTLVQSLVDEGRITEADASTHPQRSVITRALDGREDIQPDLSVREAKLGDRYLVCSDGLTGPVGSLDTLREALQLEDPQDAVDRLVQLALRGGGPDNITVIVADVIDERPSSTVPVIAGSAAESPQEAPAGIADSAASRARVAEGRDTPPPVRPRAPAPASRRGLRTAIGVLVLAVLIVLGSSIGYVYVRSQYFVGLEDGNVAIFRGVHGAVAGVSLNSVQERTTLNSARLSEVERDRLGDGIVAKDEKDARDIVARLFVTSGCAQQPVRTPTPAATPKPTPVPSATPSPAQAAPCT